jgi:type IV pilus assembly protein PilB
MELSAVSSEKIASLLATNGILSQDRLTKISVQCAQNKEKIVPELLKKNYVKEEDIVKVISRNFAIKTNDIKAENIRPDVLKVLPVEFIKKEKIVPCAIEGGTLKLVIADPSKLNFASKIKNFTKKNVIFTVTTFSNIEKIAASKIWDIASSKTVSKPKVAPTPVQSGNINIVEFVERIFQDALKSGTSDIHIEIFKDNVGQVRFRNDGIMEIQDELSQIISSNYVPVITRLKIMAGCDISENRLPQDGAITVKDQSNGGIDCDVRFNVLPSKFGERVVMRLLRSTNVIGLDKIGIPMNELSKFIKAIESPQGMVLVTGPTGSGKTTTLYAALAHLNKPELNILTAEDPVEYTMEGIGQIQANEGIGLTFANILRAFLRQDPEVILVGEIRDKETVDIAIKAAITGHLLLSTLHTNDAIQTIIRLTNMGVPNFMIAGALNTIVAQRLARKICPDCKKEDEKVTKDQLKEIGFTLTEVETLKVYKGGGCNKCNNSGYKGRQGIYEILDINGEIQSAIIEEKRAPEILQIAKKNGFRTMDEVARDHIKNGVITYEEFLRTITIQG